MKIINESYLSRIYKQTLEHDSGTISAWRSTEDCNEGKDYTRTEKNKRNNILKAKLLKKGYGVTYIRDVYIENSFFVIDIKDKGTLKNDLIKLGTEFEQDSITYQEKGESYSKINGRPFMFETITNSIKTLTDYTPTEIRSIEFFSTF
jgi:hypothetical protein